MTNRPARPRIGPMLRLVLGAGHALQPLAAPVLRRRLTRGKEDPERWREKLGEATQERPDGPLVWLHGVGVGEAMALRGLIQRMADARPDLRFLVTSTARSSGEVIARNLPPRTQHQYLPLDLPRPVASFLDHWRPDLAVWSDQEVWPRLAVELARRGIPQAYVAARITEASARARARFGQAYGDLYGLMDRLHAQDPGTAAHLRALVGKRAEVRVSGSLKAAAAPLAVAPEAQAAFEAALAGRRCWVLASSHPADEPLALAAQQAVRAADPEALLVIAPRDVARGGAIAQAAQAAGFATGLRSADALPDAGTAVYVADTFGELGLWYRSCPVALIGGTFDAVEGHNPWEAVSLGAAVLHGPRVANFAMDFMMLQEASGARLVQSADQIAAAVLSPDTADMRAAATAVQADMARGVAAITQDLLALLDR
ncbi:3-deoxy-D-manno-octulosonic acid transferase [Thalassorhabdomicrobium marinisediminis]|uniref:3-deoxy-D-manno-octulosonic acid transferase n=1 Tax=Thalassorhabdomicrobium marinisediminis TaxID=2170577 RepID=UPI0024922463|nr:glycosyltransferase N-terminal domain-containing protein [Thalassorhabdomicrobium marinisediminis]